MFRFMVISVLALAVATAYEFSDAEFNAAAVSRQRRDITVDPPARNKNIKERVGEVKKDFACCKGNTFDAEYYKQMHEIKRQCAIKYRTNNSDVETFDPFDCDKMARIKQLMICEGECFARAVDVIDENGKFNRESIIKRYADHLVGDIEWKKAVYKDYIDSCLAQVESKPKAKVGKCSDINMDFHRCVWSKFIIGCPADLRIVSPKCNKIRDHISQGGETFFNKKLILDFLHIQFN